MRITIPATPTRLGALGYAHYRLLYWWGRFCCRASSSFGEGERAPRSVLLLFLISTATFEREYTSDEAESFATQQRRQTADVDSFQNTRTWAMMKHPQQQITSLFSSPRFLHIHEGVSTHISLLVAQLPRCHGANYGYHEDPHIMQLLSSTTNVVRERERGEERRGE